MAEPTPTIPGGVRNHLVRGLTLVEDVVYIGLGILLSITAISLMVTTFKTIISVLVAGDVAVKLVPVMDSVLLILLVVELLYTVQVSFREHGLVAEPFLVVALISAVRRILILTAEVPRLPESDETVFRHAILELGLLTVLVLVLVASFVMMHRQAKATPGSDHA
jgi:uncharacterized membrane protein (DUF373 family)